MSKLWFVMTIFGNIASSWGPLPYDMTECEWRVAAKSVEIDKQFATKNLATDENMRIDGRQITRGDIELHCIESEERPSTL